VTAGQDGRVAVTLSVLPALEERVVDWLIDRDVATGFASYAASAHSADHSALSAAEQVSGRQQRLEFRVELARDALDDFLSGLAGRFGGADLYYYVVPVLRSGHMRRTEN
jgi:hypothetical protein